MLMVNKIYVAHYSPLKERKEVLSKKLTDYGVEAHWIEDEPTERDIERLHINTPLLWNHKIENLDYSGPIPHKQLTKSEISIAFKHLKIYKDIIANNIQTALVLEDDVVFDNDFINNFNFNLMSTPNDWDLIFIGAGCNLRIPKNRRIAGKVAYKKEHPASKCMDSYLINYSASDKIYNTVIPFTLPIDFEINYHMRVHDMTVYWWEPPIIKQGSQCGLYGSEIIK